MKSFLKAFGVSVLAGLLLASSFARAEAAVISLSPQVQAVFSQDFVVDVWVSGLDGTAAGAVAGFSAILSFDDSLIGGVSYTADPDALMGVALDPVLNDLSFGFVGGSSSPLDLYFVADISLDGAALSGLQGTDFRLASLVFHAGSAEGVSQLAFLVGSVVLSDAAGGVLASSSADGSVCVAAPGSAQASCAAVAEPGPLVLLATGIVSAAARRRRATR